MPPLPHPDTVPVLSIKEAATFLGRPLAQVQYMSGSRLLGPEYVSGSGATFYLKSEIERLAAAPRLTRDDLMKYARDGRLPAHLVVVLRQRPPQPEYGTNRDWYGFDRRADWSSDKTMRRAQDDASRMWWPVSSANRIHVTELTSAGTTVPMIISVGGLIASAREITGIDEPATAAHGQRVAFRVQPADTWADDLTNTWLDSGPGKAILWWYAE